MPLSIDNVLFVCYYLLKVALNTIKQTNKTLSIESGIKQHQTNKQNIIY
jgi:hypothetical protein